MYCLSACLLDPGISDKRDPRWVGAWWIGFVILGTLIFTFSLPLFLFPAEFKTGLVFSNKKDGEKSPQVVVKKRNKDQELSPLLRLVKNPIYMCYVFGTTFRVFGVMGYYTFKPKFLESQYKKSASTANLFSGIVGTVPAAIGLLLGGAYLTYVQPGPLQLTSFITVVELLGTMSYVSALFLGCPQTTYAALPVNNANTYGADLMCNTNCSCPQKFQPICGPDNYTNYFSACFAGCSPQSLISMNGTKQYSDCSCIDSPGVATEGFCEPNCGNNFEILILLGAIAGIIGRPAMAAFIPYPLVYGWVTNTACEVWESKCGKTGNCLVYDSDKFRNRLHGLTLTLYYIGSVFDIIVVLLSKRIKNLYEDEEEEDQESDDNINNK
ncbi:unnamed protein product [Medioppia subpectinata]|uniref:Kazal-like domain-containing protein n=1 Tax=Medioppia subpectinata TaxID=1979941 RepID=A0A7R9KDL3_9ACAR|nr:unnamed protein product [Medioppia subpectinata]CAG2100161.1 unnamed protein product [Medioppia subpectinata]